MTLATLAGARAKRRLRDVLKEHPEIRERTARFLEGQPEEDVATTTSKKAPRASKKKKGAEDEGRMGTTGVRMSADLLARAEALVPMMRRRPDLFDYARPNRSTILRLAMARGLEVLERETSGDEPK